MNKLVLKDVRLSRADLLPLMLGCLTEVNDKHSLNSFEARNLKVFRRTAIEKRETGVKDLTDLGKHWK